MAKKANQTITGKAFEYAILEEFHKRLNNVTQVSIVKNSSYDVAKESFDFFDKKEQSLYSLTASFAVNFLIDLEPRLSDDLNSEDVLQLEIVSDRKGQDGDVRDVLAIRVLQKWEIGVSAKNNHRAVKHSRLSRTIDFGDKWVGIPCSQKYFDDITPIFDNLDFLRKESNATKLWKSLGDYHTSVYMPILQAFKKELIRLDKENPGVVAQRLVEYLIGNQDFYKVIKGNKKVEIQAYNLYGTLSLASHLTQPKAKIEKLKLPTRLIDIAFGIDTKAKTTLYVSLDQGWQMSFRIHNASSRIEPSLKFDVNLESSPHSLFTNHLFIF